MIGATKAVGDNLVVKIMPEGIEPSYQELQARLYHLLGLGKPVYGKYNSDGFYEYIEVPETDTLETLYFPRVGGFEPPEFIGPSLMLRMGTYSVNRLERIASNSLSENLVPYDHESTIDEFYVAYSQQHSDTLDEVLDVLSYTIPFTNRTHDWTVYVIDSWFAGMGWEDYAYIPILPVSQQGMDPIPGYVQAYVTNESSV